VLVNAFGDTVMLRGISLGDLASQNEYRMGGKDALDMLDVITDTSKGWFINMVRIPIHPAETWGGEHTWPKVTHEYFDSTQLKPFVDRATELGLYVLIDLHYVHNSTGKDKLGMYVDERVRDFWEFIAPRYSRYENVMYELFNEPIDECKGWDAWYPDAQYWVNLIRSYASNIIWVGAPCWSQQIGGSADRPVKGGNIGYVTHFYPLSGVDFAIDEAVRASARAPVILGEWGWRNGLSTLDLDLHPAYPGKVKHMVMDHGMHFCAWCATDDWEPGVFTSDYETIDAQSHGAFLLQWLGELKGLFLPDTIFELVSMKDSLWFITLPETAISGKSLNVGLQYELKDTADLMSVAVFNHNSEMVVPVVEYPVVKKKGMTDLTTELPPDLAPGNYLLEVRVYSDSVLVCSGSRKIEVQPESFLVYVTGGSGQGRYPLGSVVQVRAGVPPYGKTFDKWTGDAEVLESDTASEGSFLMPGRTVSLKATYRDETPSLIEDEKWTGELLIYPNPLTMNSILHVSSRDYISRICIFNALGTKVLEQSPGSRMAEIRTEGLERGVYFIYLDRRILKLIIR